MAKLSLDDQSVLRRVRARVDTEWTRGTYHAVLSDGEDVYCLVGLLRNETGCWVGDLDIDVPTPVSYGRLYDHLLALVSPWDQGESLEHWNDTKADKEMVKELIDKALVTDVKT